MAVTEESEYLDLHNAYNAKCDYDLETSVTFVQESPIVTKSIGVLVAHSKGDSSGYSDKELFEIRNHIVYILQKYQEQPGLLDPHLESWTTTLMAGVRACVLSGGNLQFLLDVVYTLCKVRGQQTLVKFFPHETQDLEPVFQYCLQFKWQDQSNWQAQYVILIWLSIIVLAPFDLDTIDSSGTLVERLIDLCKVHMGCTSRVKEAVAILLSKLLTRPDLLRAGLLGNYFSWCQGEMPHSDPFKKIGILTSIVEIFAQAQRSDLLPFIPIITRLLDVEDTNMTIHHLKVKLASRLSLVQLRPIVASWRYQRGGRNLAKVFLEVENKTKMISNCEVSTMKSIGKANIRTEEEAGMDADVDLEVLEKIIDTLLQGLRDRDTVVRWAAAKGIGRLTGRLNKELGDEVVEQVTGLFSVTEPDSSWHGGCLALGELARRGLLLPARLNQVFPLLFEALFYDKKMGNHSVGVHVRDAACYLAWSFARAYAPDDLSKHLHDLAGNLLTVCCYDREVNCRRAASAAFQEHVGRQGSFRHGIEILTEADYFTLGNRTHAYLHVSCFIAQFPEYLPQLVNHLLRVKLFHWDPVIRQLAACGLSVLVPFNSLHFQEVVLPELLAKTIDVNLLTRHGAILGVSEVLLGFSGQSSLNTDPKVIEKMIYKHATSYYQLLYDQSATEKEGVLLQDSVRRQQFHDEYRTLQSVNHMQNLSPDLLLSVVSVVFNVEKNRLYRGKGGQIVRTAVCRLIECISRVKIQLSEPVIKKLQESLDDHLIHIAEEVQLAAASALYYFSRTFHITENASLGSLALRNYTEQLNEYISGKEIPANITRGFALAIGSLEPQVLLQGLPTWLQVLGSLLRPKGTTSDDAETRRNSASAIGIAVSAVFLETKSVQNSVGQEAIGMLFEGLKDYSLDKRGDVGSWVREAAMSSIESISSNVNVTEELWLQIVSNLLQQLCEKIDKVRQVAGVLLETILRKSTILPSWYRFLIPIFIENQEAVDSFLANLEKEQGSENLPDLSNLPIVSNVAAYRRASLWSIPGFVFPLVTPLIDHPEFRDAIIRGLVVSAGGITESTMKSASQSLISYMRTADSSVLWTAFQIYREGSERLLIPFMKTWELIFRECRNVAVLPTFPSQVYEYTKTVMAGSKDIGRCLASVGLYAALLECPECFQSVLPVLISHLGHGFPKVRALAAQSLYNFLIGVQDFHAICESQDELDQAADVLISTSWTQSLKEVRPIRETIYRLLHVIPPVVGNNPAVAAEKEEGKEAAGESYGELVKEMGY